MLRGVACRSRIAEINPGGLGIITGLTQKTPELLANEIRRCLALTDLPIGVNLTFLPIVNTPDYPGYIRAIIDGGVKVVETAGNNPQKWLPLLHEAGIKVIHKCTSVRHALKAQAIGCDAIIPFVASGGMADGRSLVAALALGAEGINLASASIRTPRKRRLPAAAGRQPLPDRWF